MFERQLHLPKRPTMERDVMADRAKVAITRQQRRAGVACGKRDQEIVLQPGKPNRLVVREQTR